MTEIPKYDHYAALNSKGSPEPKTGVNGTPRCANEIGIDGPVKRFRYICLAALSGSLFRDKHYEACRFNGECPISSFSHVKEVDLPPVTIKGRIVPYK